MIDYAEIRELAKQFGRKVSELLALSQQNDPFYAGVGARGVAAEWFARIWTKHVETGAHLRRIHYRLVSPPPGVRVLLPNGRAYRNTEHCWHYLCWASLAARYLDLVPFDGLIDRRNDEPKFFAPNTDADPDAERSVAAVPIWSEPTIELPEFPPLPSIAVLGLDSMSAVQNYIVEVWVEKSTQNDWLVPLCERRGVNLVVGIGEQSEIRSRELAQRAAEYGAPVRVLYLSDFDPGGRSMPKAVARKVEFTIEKLGLDVDLELIPIALSLEQCREYDLPRTPIKDTERRKSKFEEIFGRGATELDALEALHPGELGRLLEAELDNYLDAGLERRIDKAYWEQDLALQKITKKVTDKFKPKLDTLREHFDEVVADLDDWQDEAAELWQQMADELDEATPDLSDVEVPRSEASGETDRFVLFDSKREYLEQMDYYNAWRDEAEPEA